jgi:hypothetical protein
VQQHKANSHRRARSVLAQDVSSGDRKVEIGECQRHLADNLGILGTAADQDGKLAARKPARRGNCSA